LYDSLTVSHAETLVHSTLDQCDSADFTLEVFFNMKNHTVYVKKRPYLKVFLEKVAQMFELVIFTASQRIYAEQLIDKLDPDGKYISRRIYRESCIFSDGCYTKDLTILGIDLAKVAIVDNTPQVESLSNIYKVCALSIICSGRCISLVTSILISGKSSLALYAVIYWSPGMYLFPSELEVARTKLAFHRSLF
jgi:Dullard-like phosphatase family protein